MNFKLQAVAATAAAQLAFVTLLLFVFAIGCFVAGVGLHDPDTCWLLALGRYIFQHHQLPAADPYSYTFAMGEPEPFVMYQWLCELLFFTSVKLGGLTALLILTALIIAVAFVVVPLTEFHHHQLPLHIAIVLTITGVMAACFHFLCRPEIFSYLMLAIWLKLLWSIRRKYRTAPPQTSPGDSRFSWRW